MARYHSHHAKRRKKVGGVHHKRKHGRRKMGATKSGTLEVVIGAVVGGIGGRLAYSYITGLPNYALQVAEIVGGGAVAYFAGSQPLLQGLGIGLLVSGVEQAMTEGMPGIAGALPPAGFGEQYRKIAGFRDVPRVGGLFPKPAAIGRTEQMMARSYKGVY